MEAHVAQAALSRPPMPALSPLRVGDWLITLRWVAFTGLLLVIVHTTLLEPRVGPASAAALWSGAALLGLVNIALSVVGPARALTHRIIVTQIAFDVALITALLHSAGGMTNPFAPLYVFHAVLAALLLPSHTARRVVIAIAAVAALLALVEATLLPPGCVIDHQACRALDRASLAGSGVAIVSLALGCGLVVQALMSGVQAERNRLETVVNCIADAVIFATPDGRIELANKAARSLWPERPAAATDLRVCHTPSRWAEMTSKLRNPGAHEHHPILRVGERSYEATYGRVGRDDLEALGAVMVARDVTERLREQEVREQRERMATIGKLAAALAHEINNPLGTIQLYAQHLLKHSPEACAASEHLGTILRNADVCKRIVRDLLEYARQRPPEKRPVRPGPLLVQAARTLQPHADRSKVVLELRTDAVDAERLEILADADQIIQVMVNLGINAIEALAGTDGGKLVLGLAARDGELALTATDTGPGISEAQRALIFSPFYTTKAEGTGLGLAVASDIAAAHGGRLELAQSAPGQGAEFALVLPLHPPSGAGAALARGGT